MEATSGAVGRMKEAITALEGQQAGQEAALWRQGRMAGCGDVMSGCGGNSNFRLPAIFSKDEVTSQIPFAVVSGQEGRATGDRTSSSRYPAAAEGMAASQSWLRLGCRSQVELQEQLVPARILETLGEEDREQEA